MPPKTKYPCLVCDKDVGGKTGSVQCNFCDKWVHPVCGGISKPHLDILIENPSTTWTCKPCFGVSSKIKKEVQVLTLKQDECRREIQANKEELEKVKSRVDNVERKVEEINKDEIIKLSNEIVFKELRERESRKDNLVIHKVPELVGDNITSRDRRDHDIKKVLEVFEYLNCVVSREEIKFIYRPGDKIVPDWPRPVILCLKDPGARQYILSHSSSLLNSIHSHISIVPDLTVQQRSEEEGMRKEAAKLNNELSEEEAGNWEWVLVGLRGQKRLIKRRIVEGRGRGGVFRRQGGEARSRPSEPRIPSAEQRPDTVTANRTMRGDRGRVTQTSTRGTVRGRGTSSRTSTSNMVHSTQESSTEVCRQSKDRDVGTSVEKEKSAPHRERGEKEKGARRPVEVTTIEEVEVEPETLHQEEVAEEQEQEVEEVDQGTEEESEEEEMQEDMNQDRVREKMTDEEGVETEGGGKKKGKRGRECSTSPSLPNNKKQSTTTQKL